MKISLFQGCGAGVKTGVGLGGSRPFWPQSELELESVKSGRLRPGVVGYHPSTDDTSGRMVSHSYETIEIQEEKESGSVR